MLLVTFSLKICVLYKIIIWKSCGCICR